MRACYLLLGVLLGVVFTTRCSEIVFEALEQKWEKEILSFTLTGYSEGWERGRDYTKAHIYWMLAECLSESQRNRDAH